MLLAAFGLVAALGCGARPEPPARTRPQVVATTTVVADLVRQVGGDAVTVACLLPPGVDPHAYRATPRDAGRLLAADLVVSSGLNLEGRLASLLGRMGDGVRLVSVADRLPRPRLLEAAAGIPDPHVWLDPDLWSLTASEVASALARIDPASADAYRSRAEAYADRLRQLAADVRRRIATIPEERRVLVTSHDAFRYFGRGTGLEVVGVQGVNPSAEAGLGDVNRLVDLLVSRRIPAVFLETSVADRSVAAVIEGAAARGHRVVLGGRLYADSLGGPGSDGETLEAGIAANVETIVAALAASDAGAGVPPLDPLPSGGGDSVGKGAAP